MKNLHEILVATDLSPTASRACQWAAGFALGYGARVVLLYVDEMPAAFQTSREVAAYLERKRAYHSREMNAARDLLEQWGVAVRIQSAGGRASQQILEQCERLDAGLVVVGKSGQRGLEQLLIGTTTKRLLRRIKRPLLVVPGEEASDAAWRPIEFNRLMVTTDFSEDSVRGLQLAVGVARKVAARELLLTHVLRVPPGLPIGELNLAFPDDAIKAARQDAEEKLAGVAARVGSQRISTRLLIDDGVAQAIAAAADDEQVDLIVVPSHGKGVFGATFLGSVSEGILRRSRRPVLVLPRAYLERLFGAQG